MQGDSIKLILPGVFIHWYAVGRGAQFCGVAYKARPPAIITRTSAYGSRWSDVGAVMGTTSQAENEQGAATACRLLVQS